MQDKDAEVLRSQLRRKRRVARIKSAIVMTISGWIILSMILIIFLFVQTVSFRNQLKHLSEVVSVAQKEEEPSIASAGTEDEERTQEPATTAVSGVEEEANIAAADDLHKVYLTFDEAPSKNTEKILDVLAEYDVKATFFVVGKEDEESKGIYRRIVDEGHTLGMRSYSNKYSVIYQSEEAFAEDYRKLYDYLYEVTGEECRYYRFPGGSSNQISNVPMGNLISYLNGQGTVYYDWNVSAGDAASSAYSTEEIVANVISDVIKYKTSVVLLHDGADKSTTVEALGPLIEALQEMEAEILPIDEDTQVIQYVKADSAK